MLEAARARMAKNFMTLMVVDVQIWSRVDVYADVVILKDDVAMKSSSNCTWDGFLFKPN